MKKFKKILISVLVGLAVPLAVLVIIIIMSAPLILAFIYAKIEFVLIYLGYFFIGSWISGAKQYYSEIKYE